MCLCESVCIHACVHAFVCVCVCMHTCVCMFVHLCVCMYLVVVQVEQSEVLHLAKGSRGDLGDLVVAESELLQPNWQVIRNLFQLVPLHVEKQQTRYLLKHLRETDRQTYSEKKT